MTENFVTMSDEENQTSSSVPSANGPTVQAMPKRRNPLASCNTSFASGDHHFNGDSCSPFSCKGTENEIPKKSSDAKWRANLKTSYQILQHIACPERKKRSVYGKNVRKDLLDGVLVNIQRLEEGLGQDMDLGPLQFYFDGKEREIQSKEGDKAAGGDQPRTHIKIIDNQVVHLQMKETDDDRLLIHLLSAQPAGEEAPTEVSTLNAIDFMGVMVEDNPAEETSTDPLQEHNLSSFDLHSYLMSTPQKEVAVPVRKPKRKFADSKKVSKVRRRLDFQAAAGEPQAPNAVDDPPASLEQSVNAYLELSFSQLLAMEKLEDPFQSNNNSSSSGSTEYFGVLSSGHTFTPLECAAVNALTNQSWRVADLQKEKFGSSPFPTVIHYGNFSAQG